MRRRPLVLLGALALGTAALALGAVAIDRGADRSAVSEHPVTVPATTRAVDVSRTMPAPSRSARQLSAMLEEGTMPGGETTAEVMSDTECTPDARMISRCRNELRLPDGSTLVLRHPHDMRHVPCLAPGEHVLLVQSGA